MAAIVASSDDAIIAKDLNGIITDWNRSAERIFGYTAAEAIGRSITMLLPADRPHEEHDILATLRRGDRIDHFDTARVRKDGSTVYVSISVSPIKDVRGRIVGAAKIARDVSERKLAEAERERLLALEHAARAEAERASRAKDEFLSMVSHELRTPLASILAWVRVLQQGKQSPERTAQALRTIESNGRIQAELIEDLLDVSRIVAGRLRLAMRPVSVRTVVRAALDAVQPDVAASGLRLSAELGADGPVAADETRLQRVVSNVLDNAIKFTPPGGRIDVVLGREGDVFLISVRDTGRGIPRELLPHVCEPFWQAEDVKTRKRRGLGLGLAIVHSLILHHGGSVAFDSPGEGLGTTATLRLPILRGVALPAGASDPAPRVDGHRVLVVDADDESRQVLRAMLEDRGAMVSVAASAADARAHLTGGGPDVLVSAFHLASDESFASMDELRQTSQLRGVPAIAITTGDAEDGPRRALASGFHAYFGRPFDAGVLVGTIATLAGREDPRA